MAGPEPSLAVDEKAGGDRSSSSMPEQAPTAKTPATALLSDAQKQILSTQLDSPEVKVSFLALYRYADGWDVLIIAVSVLCAIAAGAALPLLSIFFGQLTLAFQDVSLDTITFDEFESQLVKNVVYFVYVGLAEFVTVYVSTVGFIYTGERIAQRLRAEYLKAVLRQNVAYFDNLGAGEITTRITADTNLVQDGISQKVALTLTAVATFVTGFVIAYVKFWKLALICTSTLVAFVAVMGGGSRFIVKFSTRSLQDYAVGSSLVQEVLGSIRTATAFGTHERLAAQYESHLKVVERHGIRMQVVQAVMVGAMYAISFLNYGLGFWQGARFLVDGDLDAGGILTVLMAIMTGSYAVGNVFPHSQAFTNAMAAASKIYSTIDRQSPLDPSSKEGNTLERVEGNIELRGVTHVYPSRPDVVVLDDVSLSIPAGRTTALVGPSGSGKSSIIGLLERFYIPVGGELLLDGHQIQDLNLRWLRQQISLVSQEPNLFSTTIFENIRFGLIGTAFENAPETTVREKVEEAAAMANAHAFITTLPEGYQTQVGEGGLVLSGGQKQCIAIARAVISDPKILLLDEATSALDTRSEKVVQAALDRAAEGRTTVVIAHRLSTIRTAHKIVVLAGGKIVEQGTHDELRALGGDYHKLVEAQKLNEDQNPEEEEVEDLDEVIEKVKTEGSQSLKVLSNRNPTLTEESKEIYKVSTLIRFVASFNRKELKLILLGVVFVVLAGCAQPAQAVLYAKAITAITLSSGQLDTLQRDTNFWALMLMALGLAQLFLYAIQGTCLGISSEKLTSRARGMAFRTMLRQDVAFFDRDENTTGSLTSFLSAETRHLSGISGIILGSILMVTTTLTASLVIALVVGWKLALVCISVVPLLLICGFWRVSILAQFQLQSKTAYEASATYACEATTAIRTVAALTKEDAILATYHRQLGRQARDSLIWTLKSSSLYALSQAMTFFCQALAFWYGGTLLARHEYGIFQFFVCFSEVMYGANAAGAIFHHASDMGKAKNAATDFKRLFDRRPAIDVWSQEGQKIEGNACRGAIEFRDVHFRYPTRPAYPVLSGLSFRVEPGQYVALVGASGCGKSTTIALLERFYDVLSGGIYLDGKDISQLNVNSYRSLLALVSQEPTLYQGTVRDNILLGTDDPNVSEEAVVKACKEANIYDFIMSLPDGFDTIVGSKGSMLSGGQKQRVAIARALIRNPRVLLLDESTSALDSESEKVVQAALDAAAKGRTTIAVAHRLSTVQKADVILVFDQGRIVESGTHQELVRRRGHYHELANLQNLG
ncbi:ABC multidrug transporter Mdr1 [Apiospora saccharicola]|uniref:ABC multidrug transporter Mdr1 n=1 Tax=Apiospora saccharicola TaxID=335842 RepID=A0ABR1U8Y9_9PEZI